MGRAARSAALGVATTAALALATIGSASTLRAAEITEAEAQAIGLDAYLYFYPLITMDVTRRQLTNVEAGKSEIGGPANMFTNVPAFPTADMKVVVRPNFDTLYSIALARPDQGADGRLRARYAAGATTCCPCSTCGPTCSPRPAGGRPARRRRIIS